MGDEYILRCKDAEDGEFKREIAYKFVGGKRPHLLITGFKVKTKKEWTKNVWSEISEEHRTALQRGIEDMVLFDACVKGEWSEFKELPEYAKKDLATRELVRTQVEKERLLEGL